MKFLAVVVLWFARPDDASGEGRQFTGHQSGNYRDFYFYKLWRSC